MNPDTKSFEPETPATPPDWTRWKLGEILFIKGVPLEIERVTGHRVILRPVGQAKPQPKQKKSKPVKLSRGLKHQQERKQQRAREEEAAQLRRGLRRN